MVSWQVRGREAGVKTHYLWPEEEAPKILGLVPEGFLASGKGEPVVQRSGPNMSEQVGDWGLLAQRVSCAVDEMLPHVDVAAVSLKEMRGKLEEHLSMGAGALEPYKQEVAGLLSVALGRRAPLPSFVESLPAELPANQRAQMVYLCTVARVLPGTLEVSDLRDIRPVFSKNVTVLFFVAACCVVCPAGS